MLYDLKGYRINLFTEKPKNKRKSQREKALIVKCTAAWKSERKTDLYVHHVQKMLTYA